MLTSRFVIDDDEASDMFAAFPELTGDADWDESKHPRNPKGSGDPSGEFTTGEGGVTLHGTSGELLKSISKKGIILGKKDPHTYITNELNVATNFALMRGPTWPIILEIKIPQEHAKEFESIFMPSGSEVKENTSFRSSKPIPPAWIVGYHLIDRTKKKGQGQIGPLVKMSDAQDDLTIYVVVSSGYAADFNPYHKPGGSSEGGEFAEAPGVKAVGIKNTKKVTEKWFAKSDISNLDEVMVAASVNQNVLIAAGNEIAGTQPPVEFLNPGQKSEKGVQKKLDRGKPAANITDAARGGFSVKTPAQAQRIADFFAKHFPIADEGWQETKAGYFDRKLMVKFKNGQVGEIQMWPPGMLEAKEYGGGHKIYDVTDQWQIAEKIKKGGPKSLALQREMARLYGGVKSRLSPVWKSVKFGASGK